MFKGNSFTLNCTVLSRVMAGLVEFGLPDTDQLMGMICSEQVCVQKRPYGSLSNQELFQLCIIFGEFQQAISSHIRNHGKSFRLGLDTTHPSTMAAVSDVNLSTSAYCEDNSTTVAWCAFSFVTNKVKKYGVRFGKLSSQSLRMAL